MAKSNEAFFWSLFALGGGAAGVFIPAMILATGFLLPTGDEAQAAERYEKVFGVVSHPLTKVVLFGVLFVTLFHCAHRIQHTSKDVGLRPIGGLIAGLCYLAALLGTIIAGYIILGIR